MNRNFHIGQMKLKLVIKVHLVTRNLTKARHLKKIHDLFGTITMVAALKRNRRSQN